LGQRPRESLLYKAGIKLPHPEPYGGSADLEKFEVFITGILRWLSVNNMLGKKATELQLGYLGACLKDEALEWFSQNVERPDRIIRD
jgi:hypothetical protein